MSRVWIVDGHNVIFAVPGLRSLQTSDRREEARAELLERLERFAAARAETVLVVFDAGPAGGESGFAGGARAAVYVQIVYARRGEGAADERIIREATARCERGAGVTVVTDDVATLARRLPRGVRHVGVADFWLKHIEREPGGEKEGAAGKRIRSDVSDLERDMLRLAAAEEATVLRARRPSAPSSAPARPRPAAAESGGSDHVRLKRARGRLRQERRLRRYTKS